MVSFTDVFVTFLSIDIFIVVLFTDVFGVLTDDVNAPNVDAFIGTAHFLALLTSFAWHVMQDDMSLTLQHLQQHNLFNNGDWTKWSSVKTDNVLSRINCGTVVPDFVYSLVNGVVIIMVSWSFEVVESKL